MAVLNTTQLEELRRHLETSGIAVTYTKVQVNAALQAIEDWFEANRTSLSTAINAGTAPFTFTGAQKVKLVKFWLLQKAGRE